jgi:hypothetical protein
MTDEVVYTISRSKLDRLLSILIDAEYALASSPFRTFVEASPAIKQLREARSAVADEMNRQVTLPKD